jgi:hypothetical protein
MLGWKAGPEQYDPVELLSQALAAEKAGFETINVSDHFHPWDEEGQACFTWTWLGAAAATVERMNPGPACLGVGTGEALNEYSSAVNGSIAGRDTIRSRQCISADPDAHAKFAQQFIDLGFDKVYFHSAGPDQYAFIDGYGRKCCRSSERGTGRSLRPARKQPRARLLS